MAVFDFATVGAGDYGKQIADSVRLRMARHVQYEVLDGLTVAEASGPLAADADHDKVVELMTKRLGAHVAFYGTVARSGAAFNADVRCIDLRLPGEPTQWARTFSDATQRARGEIAKAITEALTGQLEWKPPQYGDEPEPKNFAAPLNVNGGFEEKLVGWERPDNVSTLVVAQTGRGGVLRINTALARDPWLEYTRKLLLGQTSPDNPPEIAHDTSYGCVGALEGVHYKSLWIKADPGKRYWLTADCRGGGGAMIFVKGFRDYASVEDSLSESALARLKMTPEEFAALPEMQRKKLIRDDAKSNPEGYRRECYRWYLNCGSSRGEWTHFAAPMPPRGGLPRNVEWLQIQIYAYWPPGDYYFDNVNLYEDPVQTAPLPEEPARTPNRANERQTPTQPATQP